MSALRLLALLLACPTFAARPELERELTKVVDLFYDLDLDLARAAADRLIARRPGHPSGPFYRAVASYQRWIAEGMRSTDTMRLIEADLDAAESAGAALERADPAEGHYDQGAALGFRARALAARRQYIRAVSKAVSSVKHLKKALALDPSLEDARLGLGLYHYYAARMPIGAKPLAYLLVGEGGDRRRGLDELWRVAESTGAARMEARSALAVILSSEGENELAPADRLLVELAGRYPRNPIYRLRRAYIALRRDDPDAAVALAEPEGAWLSRLHPAMRPPARAWALYRSAEARLLHGRSAEASAWLDAVESLPHPQGLRDWVLLRRGNCLDAAGRREEAAALYARVQDRRPATLAARFLAQPYPAGSRDPAPFFTGY